MRFNRSGSQYQECGQLGFSRKIRQQESEGGKCDYLISVFRDARLSPRALGFLGFITRAV